MTVVSTLKSALLPCALALTLAGFSAPAVALDENITAIFRPDPTNPMVNTFKNTTPESGICPGHIPAKCKAMNIFTIRNPAFGADSNAPILAYHEDPRQGAYFKVPSEWRNVQVTHAGSGAVETVQMRIAGVGAVWFLPRPPGVSAWATTTAGWDRYWRGAPAPCQSVNYLAAAVSYALFFWIVPEGAGACSVTPGTDIPWLRYGHLEYAYELKTPNPLGMTTGDYTGTLSYTMGPGADFDFGDVMIPDDSSLNFNFNLTVAHELKVDIPPGGNRIELLPQGGWQAWLHQGRPPSRLFRDQTFSISSSTRFKMQLECGLAIGNTCGLRNEQGDEVPLQVAVTLPYGLSDGAGQAVNKLPLRLDGSGTELFQPVHYVNNRPATLNFEVERADVARMLEKPGSTYTGVVTVIWDSDI